ncbi:MAG: ribonuclease HII [Nitrososphaerales archaeon]
MSKKLVGGVDDAGRGCIIGPLVLAGVALEEGKVDKLTEIGVRDSKTLSPAARTKIYSLIKKVADRVVTVKVPPEEVDKYVIRRKKFIRLNLLEAEAAARVIEELGAEVVYVDASDTDPIRFRNNILASLKRKVVVISEHAADRTYPVVSAASIVAKVERDAEISILREKYGDFGSGYPADPSTISFLRDWLIKYGDMPPFARRSWRTWKRLVDGRLV